MTSNIQLAIMGSGQRVMGTISPTGFPVVKPSRVGGTGSRVTGLGGKAPLDDGSVRREKR